MSCSSARLLVVATGAHCVSQTFNKVGRTKGGKDCNYYSHFETASSGTHPHFVQFLSPSAMIYFLNHSHETSCWPSHFPLIKTMTDFHWSSCRSRLAFRITPSRKARPQSHTLAIPGTRCVHNKFLSHRPFRWGNLCQHCNRRAVRKTFRDHRTQTRWLSRNKSNCHRNYSASRIVNHCSLDLSKHRFDIDCPRDTDEKRWCKFHHGPHTGMWIAMNAGMPGNHAVRVYLQLCRKLHNWSYRR